MLRHSSLDRPLPAPDARAPFRFADLFVGQSATVTKTITEADVEAYATITGDRNPAHFDQAWAEQSPFGGLVAHGMLTAGLISTVIGMHLPGTGAVYLQQTLRFTASVRIGDTVTARAEILELITERRRMRLRTSVANQRGEIVLDGEALVKLAEENG